MSRNFGVRERGDFDRFWNEPTDDHAARWPYFVIGAAVLAMIVIGIFA